MSVPPSRAVWPPQPGLFRLRLAPRAWAVPARILHAEGRWQAEVDGDLKAPHPDPIVAEMVATIWHGAIMVDQSEYDWLIATKDHARTRDPDHPSLHPRRPIDPRVLAPLIPRTPHP